MNNKKLFKTAIFAAFALVALTQGAFAAKSKTEIAEEEIVEIKKPKKGRGALYVSADTVLPELNFSNIDFSSIQLNNVNANLDWKMGNYIFMGIEGGYNFNSTVWDAGLQLGLNLDIGPLRPYGAATALYVSDQSAMVKLGGGLDVKFKSFMVTAGYTYNLKYDLTGVIAAYPEDGVASLSLLQGATPDKSHAFSIGVGLTW